jgi:regulator of replication initiation timing
MFSASITKINGLVQVPEEEYKQLREQNAFLANKMKGLGADLDGLLGATTSMKKEINGLQEEITRLTAEKTRLKTENAELLEQLQCEAAGERESHQDQEEKKDQPSSPNVASAPK